MTFVFRLHFLQQRKVKENHRKGKIRLKIMNLDAIPKQDFLDDQEKGTDLKIHLERTGTTRLIWGCLEPRAAFRRRFPVLVAGQIWAALRSLGP